MDMRIKVAQFLDDLLEPFDDELTYWVSIFVFLAVFGISALFFASLEGLLGGGALAVFVFMFVSEWRDSKHLRRRRSRSMLIDLSEVRLYSVPSSFSLPGNFVPTPERRFTMRKIFGVFFLLVATGLFLTGCSDDGPAPKTRDFSQPPAQDDWQWQEGDSYDPGYWPKWKNPCPGPACDPPYQLHPDWLVDPPPDDRQGWRMEEVSTPAAQPPTQAAGSGAKNGGQQ